MTAVLEGDGVAAPPRANGELVFAEPWEGRAFGMVVTLVEAGWFTWDEFRDSLVARVSAWEADHAPGEEYRYYRCWLAALEDRVVAAGVLDAAAVTERSARLAERSAGHDHAEDGHGHRRRCGVDEEDRSRRTAS
ncbi:MAG TPA: nitrile hydratase accessory protein [Actinomycetospora sp.]|nr:nitrile hydratase accessory protein [Actinomycetospora sp.]